MTESFNDLILLDTNILVYAFDSSEEEKHTIARGLLFGFFSKEQMTAVSIQSLSEFFTIATKKLPKPIDKQEAQQLINNIIDSKNFKILKSNEKTIISAIETHIKYDSSYWDSLIAETMRDNKVFTIMTENEKDFKKIPWLTVINPFR